MRRMRRTVPERRCLRLGGGHTHQKVSLNSKNPSDFDSVYVAMQFLKKNVPYKTCYVFILREKKTKFS